MGDTESSLAFISLFTEALAPLLASRSIETDFQPIVSVRRGKIIALEALSRFRDATGKVTSPADLFQSALDADLRRELDWVCMNAALRRFLGHHRLHSDTLIFLNVHASTLLDNEGDPVQRLITLSKEYGIPHPNIALEMLESGVTVSETKALEQVVQRFKKQAFLVALDDLGIENSNLDRIILVCPDVVKADRSLVMGIDHDRYKQSIFRGLAEIAERIGGWLIGEGVETQSDALCALDLGGDLFQGYLFGRPQLIEDINRSFEELIAPVARTADAFKRQQIAQAKTAFEQRSERDKIAQKIVNALAGLPRNEIEPTLHSAIKDFPKEIESACWLDADGVQQTDALINPHPFLPEKTIIYHPPRKGDSHALKEYFYLLMEVPEQPNRFETNPYVPLPTTDLCITSTSRFQDAAGETAILCLHLRLEQ